MDAEHGLQWTREIHRPVHWCCELGHDEKWFGHENEFEEHVRLQHREYSNEPELTVFKEWCETRLVRPPFTCPVCNCIPPKLEPVASQALRLQGSSQEIQESDGIREELLRHIASHLKQMGFISLAYLNEDEDEAPGSRNASGGEDDNKDLLSAGKWIDGEWIPTANSIVPSIDPEYADHDLDNSQVLSTDGIVWDALGIQNSFFCRDPDREHQEALELQKAFAAAQPHSYYPIVGVSSRIGAENSVSVRREINEWYSNPNYKLQVSLFLKALKHLQEMPPEHRDSYFQIAGIHGMPYTSWDEPLATAEEIDSKGYSMNGNCLFPVWNRLYILLFEQRLYEIMVAEVIPQYQKQFHRALNLEARRWRLPYWDWAAYPRLPLLAREPKVTVEIFDLREVIDNPLYQFRMPGGKPMGSHGVGDVQLQREHAVLSYGACIATSRRPTKVQTGSASKYWINGVVNEGEALLSIDGKYHGSAREMVYRLLTHPLEYEEFSTGGSEDLPPDANLEFISANIHWWTGGAGGHMSEPAVASFDPIFWLHRCNIDRIWATWQEMNPEKWFSKSLPTNLATVGLGNVVSNKTPLRPFHKDEKGTYWRPEDICDFCSLGYTYPELPLERQNNHGRMLRLVNIAYEIMQQYTSIYPVNAEGFAAVPRDRFKDNLSPTRSIVVHYAILLRFNSLFSSFIIDLYLKPTAGGHRVSKKGFVESIPFFHPKSQASQGTWCVALNRILARLWVDGKLASFKTIHVWDVLNRLTWRASKYWHPMTDRECADMNIEIVIADWAAWRKLEATRRGPGDKEV
ncbi:hypothetical protein BJX64DRAFT_259434 [Aspergillus heterothallicus]